MMIYWTLLQECAPSTIGLVTPRKVILLVSRVSYFSSLVSGVHPAEPLRRETQDSPVLSDEFYGFKTKELEPKNQQATYYNLIVTDGNYLFYDCLYFVFCIFFFLIKKCDNKSFRETSESTMFVDRSRVHVDFSFLLRAKSVCWVLVGCWVRNWICSWLVRLVAAAISTTLHYSLSLILRFDLEPLLLATFGASSFPQESGGNVLRKRIWRRRKSSGACMNVHETTQVCLPSWSIWSFFFIYFPVQYTTYGYCYSGGPDSNSTERACVGTSTNTVGEKNKVRNDATSMCPFCLWIYWSSFIYCTFPSLWLEWECVRYLYHERVNNNAKKSFFCNQVLFLCFPFSDVRTWDELLLRWRMSKSGREWRMKKTHTRGHTLTQVSRLSLAWLVPGSSESVCTGRSVGCTL